MIRICPLWIIDIVGIVGVIYCHFPNNMTLCFRLEFLHDDFLNRYQLDLQIHWNLHIKQKPTNTLTNGIHCVFDEYFLKILQNTLTVIYRLKTRTIVHVNINETFEHYTFKSNLLYSVFLIEVCALFTTNRARHTLNAIGHCIVWFVFDMLISFKLKIQSLSLLWWSCEKFRPLAEAMCHTVWKMIVNLSFRTT